MDRRELLSVAAYHPILKVLRPKTLEAVFATGRVVGYRKKRPVLSEGDPPNQAYCLLEGSVRVFHRHLKSEVLLKLFRAPALFGEMEVLAGYAFLEYVTTLEPSTLLLIPANTFRRLVKTEPAFAQALAMDLAARLCISAHNQRALAFYDVDTRLANLLLDYAEFFGVREGNSVRLGVALSQESMARDLAVTRKALGVGLSRLKKAGLLSKESARYLIRDIDALRARSSRTLRLSYESSRVKPID